MISISLNVHYVCSTADLYVVTSRDEFYDFTDFREEPRSSIFMGNNTLTKSNKLKTRIDPRVHSRLSITRSEFRRHLSTVP